MVLSVAGITGEARLPWRHRTQTSANARPNTTRSWLSTLTVIGITLTLAAACTTTGADTNTDPAAGDNAPHDSQPTGGNDEPARLGSVENDPIELLDRYHRLFETIDYDRIPTYGQVVGLGANFFLGVLSLEGRYSQVHVSEGGLCTIDLDARVRCWIAEHSDSEKERQLLESFHSNIPKGRFAKVVLYVHREWDRDKLYELNWLHACALGINGAVECWPSNEQLGGHESCRRGFTNAEYHCWGSDGAGQLYVPDGPYVDITVAPTSACGVKVNGEIICWGNYAEGTQDRIPPGSYQSASSLGGYSCGVERDSQVNCWGIQGVFGVGLSEPSGFYWMVDAGHSDSCGVRVDGSVNCWTDLLTEGVYTDTLVARSDIEQLALFGVRRGPYKFVDVVGSRVCGLILSGEIRCWGITSLTRDIVPEGKYISLSDNDGTTCGIRSDLTVVCWGELLPAWVADPPEGIRVYSVVEEWL